MKPAKAFQPDDDQRTDGERFDSSMRRILGVTREELAKREAAYQKSRESKPRPGPRRKK